MSNEDDTVPAELLETDSEDDAMFLSDSDDSEDEGGEEDEDMEADEQRVKSGIVGTGDGPDDDSADDEDEDLEGAEAVVPAAAATRKTYIPNVGHQLDPEELEYDESAYIMYHKAECGYPCLSFDVIRDDLGTGEERANAYPLAVHLVAGTQAPKAHANKLLVMKMSNLVKIKRKRGNSDGNDDDEHEGEDEEEAEEEPELSCAQIAHNGAVNRVRTVTLGSTQVAASWSELGNVHVWDLTKQIQAVGDPEAMAIYTKRKEAIKPVMTFSGHRAEGYGLDWSPVAMGYLASGDCKKNIHVWRPQEGFTWHVDQQPLVGHTDSIEDIQWSPTEQNILASCSVDKTIRVWDIRTKPSSCMITVPGAHESDINVISWNRKEAAFLLSGGDDGAIKTWDLRQFGGKNSSSKSPQSIATFKHHLAPITSLEWHPTDSTVFSASGDDNQITLWDLAVERDEDGGGSSAKKGGQGDDDAQLNKLPPQLLFIHQGQNEIKEIHWHSQIPGLVISTALSGFDVFRTISV